MLRNRNGPGAAALSPLSTSTYDDQNFRILLAIA